MPPSLTAGIGGRGRERRQGGGTTSTSLLGSGSEGVRDMPEYDGSGGFSLVDSRQLSASQPINSRDGRSQGRGVSVGEDTRSTEVGFGAEESESAQALSAHSSMSLSGRGEAPSQYSPEVTARWQSAGSKAAYFERPARRTAKDEQWPDVVKEANTPKPQPPTLEP